MTRLCQVLGCDRRHHARGMCNTHYAVWRYGFRAPLLLAELRYGTPATSHHPHVQETGRRAYTGADEKVIA